MSQGMQEKRAESVSYPEQGMKAPRRESPIDIEHNRVSNELDKAHALLGELASRIEPILTPDMTTAGSSGLELGRDSMGPRSNETNRFAQVADGLAALNGQMGALLERVEF